MNTESLKQFRDPAQKAPKEPPWKPPLDKELSWRDLIVFDPSLGATGVVALSSTPEGVTVREAHKFPNPETGAIGGEDSFRKAMILIGNVTFWRQNCVTDVTNWDFVHEAPPIGGGRIRTPESAWLASMAVRSSMWNHTCIGMMAPQRHKFFFSGNSKASKKEHHTSMLAIAEQWGVQGLELVKNEATRDALSIGLTWLSWEHNVKRLGKRDV